MNKGRYLNCLALACFCLFSTQVFAKNLGVNLKVRVYLQGALTGLPESSNLMYDKLREKNLIPTIEPYTALGYDQFGSGGEAIADPTLLQVTGENAIVDWVHIEIRSNAILDDVLATKNVLVQRDGDVVDVDGNSTLYFPNIMTGTYRVVIRHRNHLGAISEAIDLSDVPVSADFANPSFPFNNCLLGMITIGNKRALWGGDLNGDRRLIYQGPGNDILKIFTDILYDANNINLSQSFVKFGYLNSDANMDGFSILQGPNHDKAIIIQNILPFYNLATMGGIFEMPVLIECVP